MDMLTIKANLVTALHYDGSDDWWHAVKVGSEVWDINVWDACVFGDAWDSGTRMTAYPVLVDGSTDTFNYKSIKLSSLTLKFSKLIRRFI